MSQKRHPDVVKERSDQIFPEEKRPKVPALKRFVISSICYFLIFVAFVLKFRKENLHDHAILSELDHSTRLYYLVGLGHSLSSSYQLVPICNGNLL
jgi:hypothetical protein